MKTQQDVRKALVKALTKAHGADVMVDLKGGKGDIPVLPSGFDVLDGHVIGRGGLPEGRIIEVFGHESSGKTALACAFMAAVQRFGGVASLIETEHAFDPMRAASLGVDTDALVMSQPDTLEETLEVIETTLTTTPADVPHVIVWDSVAATPTRKEVESGAVPDGEGMAEYARLMSRALRTMSGLLAARRAVLVCVNQTRSKVGVTFGNPETTFGGNALKFYATLRLNVSPGTAVKAAKEGKALLGRDALVTAVKNKLAPPMRSARVRLYFDDRGYDNAWATVQHAKETGALPDNVKVTEANRQRALNTLSKTPGWCPPVHPAPAPGEVPADEPSDDDIPGGTDD